MKLLPLLATTHAALAVSSALVGAAPFTPALALFMVWLPLGALFAYKRQTVAALVVPASAALALVLTPMKLNHATIVLLGVWLLWVLVWSAVIGGFCWVNSRTATVVK